MNDREQFGRWGEWWRPQQTAEPNMRVSDAERHEISELLSRHFADGRLDQVEFDERVSKCMAAKTRADLAGLLDDLPRLDAPASPRPPQRPRFRGGFVRIGLLAFAVILLVHSLTTPWWFGPHIPWFGLFLLLVVVSAFRRCGRRTA